MLKKIGDASGDDDTNKSTERRKSLIGPLKYTTHLHTHSHTVHTDTHTHTCTQETAPNVWAAGGFSPSIVQNDSARPTLHFRPRF